MTLAIDTSALIKRYLRELERDLVLEAMADDPVWCASALARTETMVALHRAGKLPPPTAPLAAALTARAANLVTAFRDVVYAQLAALSEQGERHGLLRHVPLRRLPGTTRFRS